MITKLIIGGAVIAFLIVLEFCSSISNYHETYYKPDQQEAQHTEKGGPFSSGLIVTNILRPVGRFLHGYHDDIIAACTFFILIFTGFLAAYTALLWRSTSDLVSRTEQSTHAIERAYMQMSHVAPGLQFTDKEIRANVEIKNFGRTPGSISYSSLWLRLVPKGDKFPIIPEYGETPDANIPRAFLVSGAAYYLPHILNVGAEHISNILAGKVDLLMVGYVDYRDQFGGRHRSGYARLYDPNGAGTNLILFTQRNYNYDRQREEGEGHDWGEAMPS